ncbi:MAG: phospho-sugar mutase [Oscillospiraceae bacterium]|nr:phospho-sugar mutase [Oscillospiraceae bacterium]
MKDIKKSYELWCQKAIEDNDVIKELQEIKNNFLEIEDRFYKDIEFGTGGLRGVIGAGTNRINIYTVRKISQGLANYLNNNYKNPSIAIAFDSRIKSDEFAKTAACVFAANKIKVYIFKDLMPTPALSFAIRDLGCSAGVVVTASHNPAKYNGYKVYGDDGCQITLDMANKVFLEIQKIDIFNNVIYNSFETEIQKNNINYISDKTIKNYLDAVSSQAINKQMSGKENLKIVYTPLNGAGLFCVTNILKSNGFLDLTVVPEQEKPDGNFPTCPYPNPEIKEALEVGINLSKKINADLLIATDPDCDRVGIAVLNNKNYQLLNGNQVGILLFDYICNNKIKNNTMPKNPVAIKTIVTTQMLYPIAKNYDVEVIDVLTGFKFIGEQIGYLEQKSEQDRYILGFEESYGYLTGPYVRDKDGVNASLLICEMAAYYKNQNKNLFEVLEELYKKYGYYETYLDSFEFAGSAGFEKMQKIMTDFINNPPKEIINKKIIEFFDYNKSVKINSNGSVEKINLPKSNVIKFLLEGNNGVVIRPSGTEPKLKIYYSAQGLNQKDAQNIIAELRNYFSKTLNSQ